MISLLVLHFVLRLQYLSYHSGLFLLRYVFLCDFFIGILYCVEVMIPFRPLVSILTQVFIVDFSLAFCIVLRQ